MYRLADPPIGAHKRRSLPSRRVAIVDLLHLLAAALHYAIVLLWSRIGVYFHFLARLAVLGRVRALVEASEQEVEHDGVRSDEVRKGDREVAVVLEEQLECVGHHQHELDLGDNKTMISHYNY